MSSFPDVSASETDADSSANQTLMDKLGIVATLVKAAFNNITGHQHTGAVDDAPGILASGLASDAVIQSKIKTTSFDAEATAQETSTTVGNVDAGAGVNWSFFPSISLSRSGDPFPPVIGNATFLHIYDHTIGGSILVLDAGFGMKVAMSVENTAAPDSALLMEVRFNYVVAA